MITAEDINKIKNELTDEQFEKFIYMLTRTLILDSKEKLRKQIMTKHLPVYRKNTIGYINKLSKDQTIKKETSNLLKQSYISLKNVHKLIKSNSIVDANTILRSSFENLTMGIVIQEDEAVYNEFLNIEIVKRNLSRPSKVRDKFNEIVSKIDTNIFSNVDNKQISKAFNKFYSDLCLFTHSTLIVNAMMELKNDEWLNVYKYALKQNTYFMEILLHLCSKYLCKSNETINLSYFILGWHILLFDLNIQRYNEQKFNKLKDLLYVEINQKYFDENVKNIEFLKDYINNFTKEIEANSLSVLEILSETSNNIPITE